MERQEPQSILSMGHILTTAEVAAIFRLDVRTVRRYYKTFGGVRIGHALRCAVKSRRHQAASAVLPRQKFLAKAAGD